MRTGYYKFQYIIIVMVRSRHISNASITFAKYVNVKDGVLAAKNHELLNLKIESD